MSAAQTRVIAFEASGSGETVIVGIDPDLGVKFKRGEILRGESGSVEVAMILGVDETNTALVHVSESSLSIREELELIKSAIDLALEGCPK